MAEQAPTIAQPGEKRCAAQTGNGPCRFKPVEGGTHCRLHGGNKQEAAQEAKSLRNYRFSRYQARVEELSSTDSVRDLTEEIAVLRMVLETIINKCEDDAELMMNAPRIAQLAAQVEKTVVSMCKLEQSLKLMLDKQSLLNLATRIIAVISEQIEDASILDLITAGIANALEEIDNE